MSWGSGSCPVTTFPCLHMGNAAKGSQGDTWDLQGCSSQAKTFPWIRRWQIQQWQNLCAVDVVPAWRQQSCWGRAQPAAPPSSPRAAPKLQLCPGTSISEREALGGRGISDHKLQTPWLPWQLHHKICFLTFSQAPSWNFLDFLSLLFLLGPDPLRRTGVFSNFCPWCNQFVLPFSLFLCQTTKSLNRLYFPLTFPAFYKHIMGDLYPALVKHLFY